MNTQMKILTITLLMQILVVFASNTAFAQELPASQNISGTVWTDFNGNGIREVNEPAEANEPVFIEYILPESPDFAQTLVVYTDNEGHYSVQDLEDGNYEIWAGDQTQQQIHLVNWDTTKAAIVVDLPLSGHTVFMPLMINDKQ